MPSAIDPVMLVEMRRIISNDLLPDTCNVCTITNVPDGEGGSTQTRGTSGTAIACRLDVIQGREQVTGGAIQPYIAYKLSLPYDASVDSTNIIEHGGVDYQVKSVNLSQSWKAVVRVDLERFFLSPPNTEPTDEDVMLSKTLTLTDAEWKASPTTPIELVPAPGAGKTLMFFGAFRHVDLLQPYTNIDPDGYAGIGFGVDGIYLSAIIVNDSGSSETSLSTWLNSGNNQSVFPIDRRTTNWFNDINTYGNAGQSEDQPILFWVSNGSSSDFDGGDSDNVIKITTFYAEVDL